MTQSLRLFPSACCFQDTKHFRPFCWPAVWGTALILSHNSFIYVFLCHLFVLVSFHRFLNSVSVSVSLPSPCSPPPPPHPPPLLFPALFIPALGQASHQKNRKWNHNFKSHLQCPHPYLMQQICGDWPPEKTRQNLSKDDYGVPSTLLEDQHESSRVQRSHQKIARSPKPYKNQGFHFSVGFVLGGEQKEASSQAPGERMGSQNCPKASRALTIQCSFNLRLAIQPLPALLISAFFFPTTEPPVSRNTELLKVSPRAMFSHLWAFCRFLDWKSAHRPYISHAQSPTPPGWHLVFYEAYLRHPFALKWSLTAPHSC